MRNLLLVKLRAPVLTPICIMAAVLVSASSSEALVDPAPIYCRACGYEYVIEQTSQGEMGVCVLPDGSRVDPQAFLSGHVARQWSYCEQNGYQSKKTDVPGQCRECLVCVLQDGSEVEVTDLMGLSFDETTCGDGSCGIPENSQTCPVDCPPGGWDGLCDRNLGAGVVDPDCALGDDIFSDDFESGSTDPWSMTSP